MADDTEELNLDDYPGDASGAVHPELLRHVVDQPDAESKDWSAKQASLIQDYVTGRAIVDQAEQAGAQHVIDYQTVKDNLTSMVEGDPNSADLAIALASNSVEALGGDPSIAEHMHGEIAKAAITAAAGHSWEDGQKFLTRYTDHLSVDDHNTLFDYNDAMQGWRLADASAERQQIARTYMRQSDSTALDAFGALSDPTTGAMTFPKGWGQTVMGDGRMSPETRGALYTAFKNLQENGDPVQSDPKTLVDLIHRAALPDNDPDHPSVNEVLRLVGAKKPDVTGEDTYRYQQFRATAGGDQVVDENGNPVVGSRFRAYNPMTADRNQASRFNPQETGDPVIDRKPPQPMDSGHNIEDYDWVGAGKGMGGLTRGDASFISSRLGPQTPQTNDELIRLSETLDGARAEIGNDRAFGRFANWFLPNYQRLTQMGASVVDMLDPNSKAYLLTPERMDQFMPTGDDIIAPVVGSRPPGERPSLSSIFGKL